MAGTRGTSKSGKKKDDKGLAGSASRKVPETLRELGSKVAVAKSARAGDIVLRLSGSDGGTYRLSSSAQGQVQVSETADAAVKPLIEVIGDAEAVQAVLDSNVDAREQFLAGGIRVRGDLRYLSDLALELGLLKDPL